MSLDGDDDYELEEYDDDEIEYEGSSAGWRGLHLLAGAFLGLRGIRIRSEALEEAAEATYPLVEGSLHPVLDIVGVYGAVVAAIMTGDPHDEDESGRDPNYDDDGFSPVPIAVSGRDSGHEEEDGNSGLVTGGVAPYRNRHVRDRRIHRDGDLIGA